MRTPLRAALRLALTGWLGLAVVSALATVGHAADPEKILPDSTLFFAKVRNVGELREAFQQTGFGQLFADPAMKPMKDDAVGRLKEASDQLKSKLGVTISELISLPQGAATVAVVTSKTNPKLPVALLLSADAGTNADKMTEVMNKSTDQAKQANAKVGTETFKGLTLHLIQFPSDNDKMPAPPVVWTNAGSVFHIASDAEALKDFISHGDGRSDSLASVEAFAKTKTKLGDAPASWFLDINKAVKLLVKSFQAGQAGQNLDAILQITGINGLKAASGTFAFNSGAYDSVSKVHFWAPAPTLGVLKMFMMPATTLRPESWVPASVATYYTLSWDLDGAYNALNDLVNQFQPGMLQILQQQLVGPNGGEPLDLQKDIFGPLGNRITVVTDFKKPIKEDSQRFLFGVAVTDVKKLQASLSKILEITGGAPAKRDFQGTTIYDFKLPEMPAAGENNPLKDGTISLAIAKDTLFVASEPAALEGVLRGGSTMLADYPEYLAVTKQFPSKTSSINYARSDEGARASYESIKSGEFEKQFKDNPKAPDLSKFFDKQKLPDFSVFAKYLAPGGGFGLMEDDGVTFTNFILKKANP